MRYLTFNEYINIGGTLDFTAFEKYSDRACAFLNKCTFGRLKGEKEVANVVKACVRDLVDYLAKQEQQLASRSQSVGGVSESETYAVKSAGETKAEMFGIIYDYLFCESDSKGTPLLYRGAYI